MCKSFTTILRVLALRSAVNEGGGRVSVVATMSRLSSPRSAFGGNLNYYFCFQEKVKAVYMANWYEIS